MDSRALVMTLRRQVQDAEAEARLLRERIREAEARAERAEHAARESWGFARLMMKIDNRRAASAQ